MHIKIEWPFDSVCYFFFREAHVTLIVVVMRTAQKKINEYSLTAKMSRIIFQDQIIVLHLM